MDWKHLDIGFDTNLKNWFIHYFGKTRWILGQIVIKDEVKLENVTIGTYTWADQNNEEITHGRFQAFKPNTTVKGSVDAIPEKIIISGKNPAIKFRHFYCPYKIWYDIQNMEWNIELEGTKYMTRQIVGNVTGLLKKEPIEFVSLEDADIYYSGAVVLIDVEFPKLEK